MNTYSGPWTNSTQEDHERWALTIERAYAHGFEDAYGEGELVGIVLSGSPITEAQAKNLYGAYDAAVGHLERGAVGYLEKEEER